MLKDCRVAKYYTNGKWTISKKRPTVTQLIQMIAERYNIDKLGK